MLIVFVRFGTSPDEALTSSLPRFVFVYFHGFWIAYLLGLQADQALSVANYSDASDRFHQTIMRGF